MGKNNNVIQWREEMYNLATEEFGAIGTYFYTNIAFSFPFPHEREYNPFYVEPIVNGVVFPLVGDWKAECNICVKVSATFTELFGSQIIHFIENGCTPLLQDHFFNPNFCHKALTSPLV